MPSSIRYAMRSKASNAAWFVRSYLDLKRERAVHAAWSVMMPVHRAVRECKRMRLRRQERRRTRDLWTIKEERAENGKILTYFDC